MQDLLDALVVGDSRPPDVVLVVDELERTLDRGEFGAIVVHLLGLDDG